MCLVQHKRPSPPFPLSDAVLLDTEFSESAYHQPVGTSGRVKAAASALERLADSQIAAALRQPEVHPEKKAKVLADPAWAVTVAESEEFLPRIIVDLDGLAAALEEKEKDKVGIQ